MRGKLRLWKDVREKRGKGKGRRGIDGTKKQGERNGKFGKEMREDGRKEGEKMGRIRKER